MDPLNIPIEIKLHILSYFINLPEVAEHLNDEELEELYNEKF